MDDDDDKDVAAPGKAAVDPWRPLGAESDLEAAIACLTFAENVAAVRADLVTIARQYNHDVKLEADASRAAASRDRLEEVAAAKKLQRKLDALNRWELEEIDNATWFRPDRPSAINAIKGVRRLLPHVIRAAEWAKEDLPADGRGQPNMYRRRFLAPKWVLSLSCASLMEEHGPLVTGNTSKTERKNSPSFANLVRSVFQYATGYSVDDDNHGLDYYIKKIGGLHSRRREVHEEMFRRSGGKPIGFSTPGSELFAELNDINQALAPSGLMPGLEAVPDLPEERGK